MPLEIGTDKMKKEYKKDTPGQLVDKYIVKSQKDKKDNAKKFFSQVFDNPLKGFPYNEEFEVHLKEAVEELPEENLEESNAALQKKADKSGMPLSILKKVYDRGVAAWRTGHRPGTNPQQWGLARVNSFVTKGKGTWGKADKDLAQKVSGSKSEETVDEFFGFGKKKTKPGQNIGTSGVKMSKHKVKGKIGKPKPVSQMTDREKEIEREKKVAKARKIAQQRRKRFKKPSAMYDPARGY